MKGLSATILLFPAVMLFSQSTPPWTFIRTSAVRPDQSMMLRFEVSGRDSADAAVLFYHTGGINRVDAQAVEDGMETVQSEVPVDNGDPVACGFRVSYPSRLHIQPVPLTEGIPSLGCLSPLNDDPEGDAVFEEDHLDIVTDFCSFSDDSLYFGIRNKGGGFPVTVGFTYYSYLMALLDPNDTTGDPIIFTVIYTVDVTGIISPGLYKITAPGLANMTKIGDIGLYIHEDENTIILSCAVQDLMNDPDFSWYDPQNPLFDAAAITQKITLIGGTQEADRTDGATIYPRHYQLVPAVNTLPVVSNPRISDGTGSPALLVDYQDADAHFPIVAHVLFDNDPTAITILPRSLDYSETVVYSANTPDVWNLAQFVFSDNEADEVTLDFQNTDVASGPDSRIPRTHTLVHLYPNPFNATALVNIDVANAQNIVVSVLDVRGVLQEELFAGRLEEGQHTIGWNAFRYPSGAYIVRVKTETDDIRILCTHLK